jgi:hypothetical protein
MHMRIVGIRYPKRAKSAQWYFGVGVFAIVIILASYSAFIYDFYRAMQGKSTADVDAGEDNIGGGGVSLHKKPAEPTALHISGTELVLVFVAFGLFMLGIQKAKEIKGL